MPWLRRSGGGGVDQGRRSRRERWAVWAGLATVLGLVGAFAIDDGPRFLMPGPLSSVHGAMADCSACHSKSGKGRAGWLHGLVAGDPLSDSKACLVCHKMPQTAFNAHGASIGDLGASRKRLTAGAKDVPVPYFARAQAAAFPIDGVTERGLFCATCHQEHQGAGFKLATLSNEQCQSCHAVKFDGFDGHHPEFKGYPFRRRTRIIYDHAGHFGKHFPDIAKKDPSRQIPATCAACHDSSKDKRVMGVASFDQTCSTCHLDQIRGKERATGPKGVAFLTLPGLDLDTLRKKKAPIGEWPDASDAELTSFMTLIIAGSEKGRDVIKALEAVNLQDLSNASDPQIKAVTELVWEIKSLVHRLIMGKASDVFGALGTAGGTKPAEGLIADLIATLPRDVIVGAHRQWLPNLAAEVAGRANAASVSVLGAATTPPRAPPATVVLDKTRVAPNQPVPPGRNADPVPAKLQGAKSEPAAKPAAAEARPANRAADQSDDLLTLSEEELRAVAAFAKSRGLPPPAAGAPKPAGPGTVATSPAAAKASAPPSSTAALPQSAGAKPADTAAGKATPDAEIQGNVDPETWAEAGGWYRQDYAILYRPTGHKDTFLTAWIGLTGAAAASGEASPAARVFDRLIAKDAQGACAKCHSVDDGGPNGRRMNFAPAGVETKTRRFTAFIHEPHLTQAERGCLTCHQLEKGKPYLDGYKQGDPRRFVSEFSSVTKETCATCHKSGAVRQDCLTCHAYHVNDIVTPVASTKLPSD